MSNKIMAFTLSLALVFCILNPYHWLPGFDLFHNLFVAIILSAGLMAFFVTQRTLYFPKSAISWLLLFVLVLIQPFISPISYPDALVFPLGTLLIATFLSISIASLDSPKSVVHPFLTTLIGCLLITTVLQILQMAHYILHIGEFSLSGISDRITGNFYQPNQASFMFDLGLVAILYFFFETAKRHTRLLLAVIFSIFSISVALTQSRGGLIMAIIAIVGYFLFIKQPFRNKFINSGKFLALFAVSYYSAILFYQNIYLAQYADTVGSLARTGSISIRGSLQQRAWLLFSENPFKGVGWGNYSYGGIKDALNVKFFTYSEHSHFFLSQIASELGIIGLLTLIPLTILLIRNLNFKKDNLSALYYTSIIIILVYSCSEFPLWYLRFLFIFVLLMSLIDDRKIRLGANFEKLLAFFMFVIFLASSYYWFEYVKLHRTFETFARKDVVEQDRRELVYKFAVPFGYSNFRELLLYRFFSVDKSNIEYKIVIGDRVLSSNLSPALLFKQARFLAVNNQPEESLKNFQAACALHWVDDCNSVTLELDKLVVTEPKVYGEIAKKYHMWLKNFNPRQNEF